MATPQAGASGCILHEIDEAKTSPAFFSCESGELLWGQVHTVIAGAASTRLDTERGPEEESDDAPGSGGTVVASSFRYRVVARKGQWKVEAVFLDDSEGKPWHVGFVCHHVDVEGVEVLRRAAEAGLGGGGKFADLDVVSVGRYDWSGSCSPGSELIVEAVEGKVIGAEEEFDDERYSQLVMGRFVLVDAQGFPNLIQALREGKRLERRNYVLRYKDEIGSTSSDSKSVAEEKASRGGFGTHVVVADSEYDMGWMAFRNGELVGFVYDGAYSALEGDNLRIGDRFVAAQ